MIIRPEVNFITSVYDIPAFKRARRDIVIYVSDRNQIRSHDICIINYSAQDGSCGGHVTNKEVLHTANVYYGTIEEPFYYTDGDFNKDKVRLNLDALVFINEYNYLHKLSDRLMEREKTISIYDELFRGDDLLFNNRKKVYPTEPKYFNIDHQISVIHSDYSFIETQSNIFNEKGNVMYSLRELIDDTSTIMINELIYDDPYKLSEMSIFRDINGGDGDTPMIIHKIILGLINHAIRAFLTGFTVIIDSKHGYNLVDASRYLHFDKYQINDDNINFATSLEHVWETICDFGINIRLTIKYTNSKTYIQILPSDETIISEKNMTEKDVVIRDMISDVYNTCGLY